MTSTGTFNHKSAPALQRTTHDHRRGMIGRAAHGGFTLVELLVVIGLIVLLIGLLLPALANVRKAARVTQTKNLMKNLGDAADSFFLTVQRYPGAIGERQFCSTDEPAFEELSGTENALIELMGGTQQRGNDDFDLGNVTIYRADIGRGPLVDGVQHEAFFQPSPEDLYYVNGQGNGAQDDVIDNQPQSGDKAFPDLVDAFGTPIIFWRNSGEKPRGLNDDEVDLVAIYSKSNIAAPYYAASFQSYTAADALAVNQGRAAIDQASRSLLSRDNNASDVIKLSNKIVGHPSLPLTPRSRYVIMSAGPDQIYFDIQTIENSGFTLDDADILRQFDDDQLHGGG